MTALLDAGLRLDRLTEHTRLPWPHSPDMREDGDRMFHHPEDQVQLPLAVSIRATKGGGRG